MLSVNHKPRFRIDLSHCASGVRILRAPWLVWWSILYSFHINGLLNIRHKYSTYGFNTKAISYDFRWFIPKRSLFLTDRTFFNGRICSLLLSLLVSYRTHRERKKSSEKWSLVNRSLSPIWEQGKCPSPSIAFRQGTAIWSSMGGPS